jgi:hypothetical protein
LRLLAAYGRFNLIQARGGSFSNMIGCELIGFLLFKLSLQP